MKEAENLMKGYVNEDYFFIIHDALVLMTAKETIEWMKEKNYFHHKVSCPAINSWAATNDGSSFSLSSI